MPALAWRTALSVVHCARVLPLAVSRLLSPELAQRLDRALETDDGPLRQELCALLERARRRGATPEQTALATGLVLALRTRASEAPET